MDFLVKMQMVLPRRSRRVFGRSPERSVHSSEYHFIATNNVPQASIAGAVSETSAELASP